MILLILRSSPVILRAADALVADLGLSASRWRILATIAISPTPRTAPQIAKKLGLTRQAVQQQLNALLDLALIWPAHNTAHSRSPVYRLTEEGRAAHRVAEERQLGWMSNLSVGMRAANLAMSESTLRQLLVKMELRDEWVKHARRRAVG